MSKQKIDLSKKYFDVIIHKGDKSADILLYGYIGRIDWVNYGGDNDESITDIAVVSKIRELEKDYDRINVRINSVGGSVYHGNAIINAIRNCKKEVHTYNDGIAASMGAQIWMASENRHMASNAMLMVHSPSTIAFGNAKELRAEAEMLDKMQSTLVAVMVDATGMKEAKVLADFYNYEDHWFNAKECKEKGFITSNEEYEVENKDVKDVKGMTYSQMVAHFEKNDDKEAKGWLAQMAAKFTNSITRTASASIITKKSDYDMKIEDLKASIADGTLKLEDVIREVEAAGHTVTATAPAPAPKPKPTPAPEASLEEQIAAAVAAAVKPLQDEITALGKQPGDTTTMPNQQVEARFEGKTPEQIKLIRELEAEAKAELEG